MNLVDPRATTPAELAKAALKRLALARQAPTPENYARAWAEETGGASPARADDAAASRELEAQGQAWASLTERLVAGLERGGRQWTAARRKQSLQRVLQTSRNDPARLLQRLKPLVQAWHGDHALDAPELAESIEASGAADDAAAPARAADAVSHIRPGDGGRRAVAALAGALESALPASDARAAELAQRLAALGDRLAGAGADATQAPELDATCAEAQRWFGQHHRLVDQLAALCRELTQGLSELAEDSSWVRGQCAGLEAQLAEGLSLRALRAAADALRETRRHQQRLCGERAAARDALKQLLAHMLGEVGELGQHTGVFMQAVQRHAEGIAGADSVEGLTEVVQAMLADSRAVHDAVGASQVRLQAQQSRASELEERVRSLEAELRRISDEASTDALTQVANRRGLEQAFAAESTRCAGGSALAVGLIDIDNFKRLNDRLGHAAGDRALKALAAAVRERLRPLDHVARFGGEEFVVLLPDTELDAAAQTLTRLQRSLSASLFLHEGEEVFVTFSAGVTLWRPGEALEAALARADEALYEAKQTGKNRTCRT